MSLRETFGTIAKGIGIAAVIGGIAYGGYKGGKFLENRSSKPSPYDISNRELRDLGAELYNNTFSIKTIKTDKGRTFIYPTNVPEDGEFKTPENDVKFVIEVPGELPGYEPGELFRISQHAALVGGHGVHGVHGVAGEKPTFIVPKGTIVRLPQKLPQKK